MVSDSHKDIRVRLAPSPTGPLHLGTARTALFNWLFAKSQGGVFVLRIEDTDLERSAPEYEKDILENLQWLGLNWDEGPVLSANGEISNNHIGDYRPYRQTERKDIYEKYITQLLEEDLAYYCYCSKEELEEERQAMLSQGLAPKYSGRCRHQTAVQNRPSVIRFKMPETEVVFNDLIRGKVKFNSALFGDIVIAKDARTPLYNLAVVLDDFEMKISHIIRGEDHISNTPKQILLQKALNFSEPIYAHLPLILSPDRKKLSKRDLETSVADYRRQGYLPEALFNFLALLSWHPFEDKEIISREELLKEFNIKKIQKAGAVFNIEKLDWLNGQYLNRLEAVEVAEKLKDFIPEKWSKNTEFLTKIVGVEKQRMKKLTDFADLAGFFFELADYPEKMLVWGESSPEETAEILRIIVSLLRNSPENAGAEIMSLAESRGRGKVLWSLRVALSGQTASPDPLEIIEVLGSAESSQRIEKAIKKLESI